MRRTSRRAATRDGLPNLRFVWAAVEQLPPELTGVTELHVILPWGSLRRAVLGETPEVLARLAAACRPGARFLVALNEPPDPRGARDTLARTYAEAGWQLARADQLAGPEIDELHSSWARRLGPARSGQPGVLALTGTIHPPRP